jgi:hypothetical protein
VYLRAESHNKVATIIFYFARAVSHAAVQTDRLNLCKVPEKLTTLQAGTQKVGGKKRISSRIRKLLRAILGAKINFLACFF